MITRQLAKIRVFDPALAKRIEGECGFMTSDDLAILVKHSPNHVVLVRCGGGRFMTPAKDVVHFVDIVTQQGDDYVRDVSLLPDEWRHC